MRIPLLPIALALWTTGCQAFLIPNKPFDESEIPTAPDYRDDAAWAALPGGDDEADRVALGERDGQAGAAADVFFVHPTTYFGEGSWNQPLDKDKPNARTDEVMAAQASAFNGAARVFAPRYRQATLGYALTDDRHSADQAFDLAYTDVAAAFAHYLEVHGGDRPLILAGHSQGAQHLTRLLAEQVVGTDVLHRLVAVYAIGAPIPTDYLRDVVPEVPACADDDDTGCLVTWSTVDAEAGLDITHFESRSRTWFPDGHESLEGKELVCINPLTWGGPGTRADHLGAVRFTSDDPPEPDSGIVAGACRDGLLEIEEPDLRAYRRLTGGGDYHVWDIGLFYLDLRASVTGRVDGFTTAR